MSEAAYRMGVRAAARGVWTGVFDYFHAWDHMYALLHREMRLAWHEGLREIGIQPKEMSPEETIALEQRVVRLLNYVDGFLAAAEEGSKSRGGKLAPLLRRADIWAARYNETREQAKSLASSNPKLEWVYGDTVDHCDSCSRVVGRVYRKNTWEKYGWVPGSKSLACGGWRCDCRRMATENACYPGRPPTL